MAEGSRRCGSSRSAHKLSLCWRPPFPKSNHSCSLCRQCCTSTAHPIASQHPFNNSSPPGNEPCRPRWLVIATFPPPSFIFSLFISSSVGNALCFFPHFSNLNNLPLSSPPSTQTKPRGACSYSLFLLCFIFYLMTQNYPLGVSSFQLRIWKKGREPERTHG